LQTFRQAVPTARSSTGKERLKRSGIRDLADRREYRYRCRALSPYRSPFAGHSATCLMCR
jgi:hypothetical protein